MQAARAAQRELIQSGRLSTVKGTERYHDDMTWSEGLVSAAKNVAASVSMLCEAANSMVNGDAGEERLVSAAMSVSAATQQLLIACRVKAHKDSKAMARLDTAGAAVRKATQELVKNAKEASARLDESAEIELNQQKVGSIAQEIAMQELIFKKEKELENARKQLVRMRQQKYSKSPTN